MSSDKKLDPTGERAEATEAMESTPISGKQHEYRADGDHRPRQDAEHDGASQAASAQEAAPDAGVEAERHISEGIPGAGKSADAQRERAPRD